MKTNLSDLANSLYSRGGDVRALIDDSHSTRKRISHPESSRQFDDLCLTNDAQTKITTQAVNNSLAATRITRDVSAPFQMNEENPHDFIKDAIFNPENLIKRDDQKSGSDKAGFATTKSLSVSEQSLIHNQYENEHKREICSDAQKPICEEFFCLKLAYLYVPLKCVIIGSI